jgi:hypothetical protein
MMTEVRTQRGAEAMVCAGNDFHLRKIAKELFSYHVLYVLLWMGAIGGSSIP